MPGETQNQPNTPKHTEWDDLASEVPFQGQQNTQPKDVAEQSPDQKPDRSVGDWYRTMLEEVDLNTDDFTERFRAGEIYEDKTKYIANKITEIDYIDDLDDDKIKTYQLAGWPENLDELTTVQPYKRQSDDKYPPEIAQLLAPSSEREYKVASARPLYSMSGDGSFVIKITPEELAQQYTQNEDGSFHNTELLRIIRAQPEEFTLIGSEQLQEADQEQFGHEVYAMPFTEYFTAPVDPQNPNSIPTTGRRTETVIRSGYGPIKG